MSKTLVQCDCCDYFSVDGSDYAICPICFWEQDAFGISEPDESSGANHELTLREGRRNFVEFGACVPEHKRHVIAESERGKYRFVARDI